MGSKVPTRALDECHIWILHWVREHTRKDKIRIECIREKVRDAPIEEKMVQLRLRLFGYVRSLIEAPIRRVDSVGDSPIVRGRGRLKNSRWKTIRKVLDLNGLLEELVSDRT